MLPHLCRASSLQAPVIVRHVEFPELTARPAAVDPNLYVWTCPSLLAEMIYHFLFVSFLYCLLFVLSSAAFFQYLSESVHSFRVKFKSIFSYWIWARKPFHIQTTLPQSSLLSSPWSQNFRLGRPNLMLKTAKDIKIRISRNLGHDKGPWFSAARKLGFPIDVPIAGELPHSPRPPRSYGCMAAETWGTSPRRSCGNFNR